LCDRAKILPAQQIGPGHFSDHFLSLLCQAQALVFELISS
jgi:hypothetical protein